MRYGEQSSEFTPAGKASVAQLGCTGQLAGENITRGAGWRKPGFEIDTHTLTPTPTLSHAVT